MPVLFEALLIVAFMTSPLVIGAIALNQVISGLAKPFDTGK